MLEINAISITYEPTPILKNVSLSVGAGEIVAVMGPNGAGKTTTLNAICGLVLPGAGKTTFDGEDTTGLPPHQV